MKINASDYLLSKSGDWHLVLKVKGEGYIQATNGISIQSRNEEKATSIFYIFDGEFMNKRSNEEVERLYKEVKPFDFDGFKKMS